jgi:hypothetical protein
MDVGTVPCATTTSEDPNIQEPTVASSIVSEESDPLARIYELGEVVAARLDGRELRWCHRHGIVLGLYHDVDACTFTNLTCSPPYPIVDKNLSLDTLRKIEQTLSSWVQRLATERE